MSLHWEIRLIRHDGGSLRVGGKGRCMGEADRYVTGKMVYSQGVI